ncbi:isochorismatase [Lactococcus hodotermopsidis]|uniref:Isochorismatase n=1 Tax=Pseudolactococcus hodotermopsidis TaxID=2709157 RepID=A0A6A0BCK9_9LACT|nr:cysteine hydrolase family protein [Lactococcus hodotermopsidis]GFH42433.1 isochorismatase [Lactococcus hodotermopsidis]
MKQALLVIDVQNDYFMGGKFPLVGADVALGNVVLLIERFRVTHQPIIYIQHIKYGKNADFFGKGTTGAELHAALKVDNKTIVVRKCFPNSFLGTRLKKKLHMLGIEQLVICGMMTHKCIAATTPVAAKLGYQPILIHDATATRDLEIDGKIKSATQIQQSVIKTLANVAEIKSTQTFLHNLN